MSEQPWKTKDWFVSPWNFADEVTSEFKFPKQVKIHDITKIPVQYFILALQKDMKPLERVLLKVKDEDVPGCEFYEDEELSQRVGR